MMHRQVLVDLVRERGWKSGAELGVAGGLLFEMLLRAHPDLRLIGVDRAIRHQRRDRVRELVKEFGERAVYLEMTTHVAADKVPNGSLDFVFIDANHRYEAVIDDIRRWTPKLCPGGTMLGHDYNLPAWPGVVKAVHEIYGDKVRVHPGQVWEAI